MCLALADPGAPDSGVGAGPGCPGSGALLRRREARDHQRDGGGRKRDSGTEGPSGDGESSPHPGATERWSSEGLREAPACRPAGEVGEARSPARPSAAPGSPARQTWSVWHSCGGCVSSFRGGSEELILLPAQVQISSLPHMGRKPARLQCWGPQRPSTESWPLLKSCRSPGPHGFWLPDHGLPWL